MKNRNNSGFTLIELMIIVVIIGVFSAVAIPELMEVQGRKGLAELVSRMRNLSVNARSLSEQTRQAVVIEVRHDKAWVNLLGGNSCNTAVNRRCLVGENTGTNRVVEFYDNDLSDLAGVAMCGGIRTFINGAVCQSETMDMAGFSFCYSGAGELFTFNGIGTGGECAGTNNNAYLATAWSKSCSVEAASAVVTAMPRTNEDVPVVDGALMGFNRFGSNGTRCAPSDRLDVLRIIQFPTRGIPNSEVFGI